MLSLGFESVCIIITLMVGQNDNHTMKLIRLTRGG